MRKAIYTVITGGYDTVVNAPRYKGWDNVLFCDEYIDSKGWDLEKIDKSNNPAVLSRKIKMLSHKHLSEYDLVCYVDGNQRLLKEPLHEPIWFRHSRRKNIYEEARQLIINGRYTAQEINAHIRYFIDQDYKDRGLYLNGYFVRDHSPEINKLHEVWYEETTKYSHRDQLTLPFAIFKTGVEPKNIQPEYIKGSFAAVTHAH